MINKKSPMRRINFFHLLFFTLSTFFSLHSFAQTNIIVSGKITDQENKMPLSNVSVSIKGKSKTGVISDESGNYIISAPANEVLVFTYLGNTQEARVPLNGLLGVSISSKQESLDEVVVIAYGSKRRKLLTESIGTVSSKEIQKLPVASADAAIQGRISGVQISNADGTPGSPVAVRIRGIGTVGNSQPLFVIDGIPVGNNDAYSTNPLSTINPADIENVSVLKDASSSALYGMRAANGVVLITTKRGKSGKPRVSLDAYYGIQQFPRTLTANNTAQYISLAQEAITNRNVQDGLIDGQNGFRKLHPDLLPGTPNSVVGINTDWQTPTIVKNAPVANYNVGVSGGTENANYFFSMGYFKQEAVTKNWDLSRYTLRANSDYKIGSRFKIGQTLAISFQEVNKGMNGGGDGFLYANNLGMPSFFKIYDDQNTIPGNRYGYNGNLNVAGFTIGNQLGINDINRSDEHNYRLIGGVYGELELIPGLKYKSAASIDFGFNRNTSWNPGYSAPEIGFARNTTNFGDGRGQGYTQVFTNTLAYEKKIKGHYVNVIAGIEYQKLRGNNLNYTGINFQSSDPAFYGNVSNGRGGPIPGQTGSQYGFYGNAGSGSFNEAYSGMFSRLSYNFKEKFLLTATVRRDGTSNFAEENRFGTFPAVSAAWIISEEPFFKNIKNISSLKLRGSWGQSGNANTSRFAYISRVSFTPQYPISGTPAQAPISPSLPNASIGWETVESTDFGFDGSFFDNKLTLLVTYYKRNTKDFLYGLPIPFTSGYGGTDVNVGNVKNSGFEFDLTYNSQIGKSVNYSISANLTTVKNSLVALAPGVKEYSSGNYRTAVGFPIGYFYGYQELGIYQNAAQASAALPDDVAGITRPQPGDVIFQDNNSPLPGTPGGQQFKDSVDGRITTADRTYLGKTIPDFFYGFNFNANYKGIDIAVFFQGVSGVQVYNQLRANMENLSGPGRNQLTTTAERWKGEGTSNTMPRAIDGDPYQNTRFSSRWVEDAGFLRLKNLQIGYSFSPKVLSKTRSFKGARIYVGATNLFVITKYTGLDPEVVTYGNVSTQLSAGTDVGSMPQPRTYQAGVQFSF